MLVPEIHASQEPGAWLEARRVRLDECDVSARLREDGSPRDQALKGSLELRRGGHLGAVTIWANGMIDFDVLRAGAAEPRSTTWESSTVLDLWRTLDACLQEFADAV